MTDPSQTKSVSYAKVSQVVVRACQVCGGVRLTGVPCATCGNVQPPQVVDLGVVSATYRNPIKRLARHLVGDRLAKRRIASANRQAKT